MTVVNVRGVIVLVAAAGIGLVAAKGASIWMRRTVEAEVASRAGDARAQVDMVIAVRDLPVSSRVSAADLMVVRVPEDSVPPTAVRDPAAAEGRITRVKLWAGEPILDPKLAPRGAKGGLQAVIPEGYRAMSVKVNESSSVSGFVAPGAHVDVVAVLKAQSAQSMPPTSKVILQNVEVLAVGTTVEGATGTAAEKPRQSPTVTLLLTPSDSEKLALATSQGEVQLVLRSFGDEALVQTPGVDPPSLVTRPVLGTAPLRQSVEVISGDRRSSTSVAKLPAGAPSVEGVPAP